MHAKRRTSPLLLLLVLPILCVSKVRAQYQGQYDPNDPPASIARIGYLQGNVSLQAAGTDDWSQAPPNYPMIGGDRLYTGPRARAVIQLGGAELRLWQATDVTLTNVTDQFQQIGLAAGALRLRVFEMDPGSQIEVDTPNGAAIIESPGDYRFEAFPQTNGQDASSIVTVNSGNAQITGPGINQPISGGYSIGLFGFNPVQLQYLDVPNYDDLDYWSIQLDQRLQNSVSARYVSRQMVGYGDLDTYGTWNPNTEYGPGWFPSQVPYGWQPYSAGHWAYVQPWGYTWVDDAPWGFAPFHYGRWSLVDGRWGWFPGPPAVRPVYSPALVAFVGGAPGGGGVSIGISFGGGVGIAAWFPIGVGEPYVPWYRCSPRYAQQVNVTNVNVAVIRNTTIVNNYNTYINNTTVNNFNYSNRAAVTAVPASAVASGTPVARQAVHLNPQQQQEIARAPISVRPTAPAPSTPHPSLVPASNVTRPAARPTLMTPTGQARAVPSAAPARPVVISKLPPPRVVPANAPPPRATPRPVQPNRPSAPVPVSAPVRPTPQPAAPVRTAPQPVAPTRSAPEPLSPARPEPVPVNRPAPFPTEQPKPAPVVRPNPVTRPEAPAPSRPEPKPAPAPVVRQPPQQAPQRPVPPPQAKPAPKPAPKPGERPAPKDEKKPEEKKPDAR
jgi:hypothetical protein